MIDGGGKGGDDRSDSDDGMVRRSKDKGSTPAKKNIELDWSIDTIATLKPTEVSS